MTKVVARKELTLKMPAKNHLKIPSAFVVCCKFSLTLFLTKLSIETNSVDPDKTAPKHFSRRQKQTNFVVIGALRVKIGGLLQICR